MVEPVSNVMTGVGYLPLRYENFTIVFYPDRFVSAISLKAPVGRSTDTTSFKFEGERVVTTVRSASEE